MSSSTKYWGRVLNYRGMQPAVPLTDDTWMEQAACAPQNAKESWDPKLHYDPDRKDEAQAVCAKCPVTEACDAFAKREGMKEGVWGGKSRGRTYRARGAA